MTLSDFIPQGFPVTLVVELAAGAANIIALFILYRAFSPSEIVGARARAHARRRRELRTKALTVPRRSRRQQQVTLIRNALDRLKLTSGEEVRKSAQQLAAAGWRSADAMTLFLGFRIGAPPLFGLLAWIVAPLVVHTLSPLLHDGAALAGAALGAFAPSLFVSNATKGRYAKIQTQLPDALDLFVICAEAGLGLDASFVRVSRELAATSPQLADELALTGIELSFLPNRRDAFANLGRRVDLASVRSLINTLAQTEKYGTPLAQSLRVLANEFRNDRLMRAEQKAARLPATLTVPMIIFILPPLFVVLIGPAAIQVFQVAQHAK
jgi:tight adherence protein C